jgi:hypothetical protein|tara:strand:- start:41 stop:2053 length:2013 start_codon:yes stop_codon:yes gene_type:complete
MTQQEQLKKALESFDEETLSATFNIEELGQIEQMLAMPNALLKQRAIDNALGIPSKEARPVEEEMSPIGQTVVGAVLPMLGDTQTGQRIGEGVFTGITAAATKSPQAAQTAGKVGKVLGGLTQSALKAAVGGTVGYEGERQVRNTINDSEFNASLTNALRAGGEEAMWDVAGNSLIKGTSKLWSAVKFRPKEGAKELQEMVSKEGSTLALDQVVDNGVISFIGELLRGSKLSAGPFERLASDQGEVVLKYYDDIISDVAGASRASLEEGGVGRLLRHSIKEGKRLHGEASGVMFSELDKAVQFVAKESDSRLVKTESIPKGFEDVFTGSELIAMNAGKRVEKVTTFKPPVSVAAIRKDMADLIAVIKNRGTVDPTGQGLSLIQGIGSGAKNLSFRDTHELMSELKRLQRDKTFTGPSKTRIPFMIESLQKSFDDAASALPNDLNKAYKRARTFSKMGAKRFNNKFVESIVKAESPSTIGKIIAQAPPEDIIRLKKALSLSKTRQGKNAVDLWPKVQAGVLETMLPQNMDQLGKTSAMGARNTNREVRSVLTATLGKEGYAKLDRGLTLVEKLIETSSKRGNFANRQAGLLLGGAAVGTGAATDTIPQSVLAFILIPKALARAMTSKGFIEALTTVSKAPKKEGKGYFLALTKLSTIMDDVNQEIGQEEQE